MNLNVPCASKSASDAVSSTKDPDSDGSVELSQTSKLSKSTVASYLAVYCHQPLYAAEVGYLLLCDTSIIPGRSMSFITSMHICKCEGIQSSGCGLPSLSSSSAETVLSTVPEIHAR